MTVIGGLFVLGFGLPNFLGGWGGLVLALLLPVLILESVLRGRSLFWTWAALFLGIAVSFRWVPHTLELNGPMPYPTALFASVLLWAWDALGLTAVAWLSRTLYRRSGLGGAAFGAALGMVLWEAFALHVYPWTWGSALGASPWTAKAAAFLGVYGLSALIWGSAGATAAALARGEGGKRLALGPTLLAGTLILLPAAWFLLPRGPQRSLDVALVQPNWAPGARFPGMEADLWQRSDALLAAHRLPRPDQPTLLLWAESSVLNQNHLLPNPGLIQQAQRRGIAWLFGTEGGSPGGRYLTYNLVRGEVAGGPSFIQAKVVPMPFGERRPGPEAFRLWLDARLGMVSQEAGELSSASSFRMPTPSGDLLVHPLICSEALLPLRVQQGVALTGAELLTNHTNDGWFEHSPATDLHAIQIRLRSVEMGMPLVRATLTGKSGLFREDGRWELWGESMTESARAFELTWRPIRTPARSPWLFRLLVGSLLLGAALSWRRT